MEQLPSNTSHTSPFDSIRHEDEDGNEYWSARELYKILGYSEWRNFNSVVIKRAMKACEESRQATSDHFVRSYKMVTLGSGSKRKTEDILLSRYAAYLVVMNGDPKMTVKELKKSQDILDYMGSDELVANIFRASLTKQKLEREDIQSKDEATQAHHQMGQAVRKTIIETGVTLPEDLPTPTKSIKQVQRDEQKRIEQRQQPSLFANSEANKEA